jgi:hypothetical protein
MGKHKILRRETERQDTVNDSPIVFVLSDQCFPPVLPPDGEGECIKIIRIEDGGVMELLDAFIEATKGFVIPAGSVLIVFSAAHLLKCGTEDYAAEFAAAKEKIDRIMRGGIQMLHGFPILLTGTSNMSLIKSILDLHLWHCNVSKGRDIDTTRNHNIKLMYGTPLEVLSAGGTGLPMAPDDSHSRVSRF